MKLNRRELLVTTSALAVAPPLSFGAESSGRVVRPRTECIDRPIGLEVERPRFSWALANDERSIAQKAYRITVCSTPSEQADLWDSGRVESDQCLDVPYRGTPLRSGQRAWWRVQVWDNHDRVASLAEPAWFEMGLLHADDWRSAQWLAIQRPEEVADRIAGFHWIWDDLPLDGKPRKFRLRFSLPAAPARAELLLACKDFLTGVWVNGVAQPLPEKKAWGTVSSFPVELVAGANVIGVEGRADDQSFLAPDGGALLALLKVTGADGPIRRLTSGLDWRTSNSETSADWSRPDFNDSGWAKAVPSKARTLCDPLPPQPAMFVRHEFDVAKPIARARLYATALGAYDAHLNGKKVGDAHLAPEISVASDHVFYQCYDATYLVHQGRNAIGALVGDGWYASAFSWQSQRYAFNDAPRRFMAQLVLEYEDGSREVIATGPRWKIAESGVRTSEIYNGEDFDARLMPSGWDSAGFDDGVWTACAIGVAPAIRLVAQIDPPIRATLTLPVKHTAQPRPGVFVCDFGQNFSGWCRLQVKGPAGATVKLRYAEVLKSSGEVDMSNLRNALATDRYTLRGDAGGESYEPYFTYHGFRYVEVSGLPGELEPENLTGIVVHTDAPLTGKLTSTNEVIQGVVRNALWSQRSNFFGVPTDCPQRDERMGWMGDIQVFLDAAAFNMDVDSFIRRYMVEVRAAQTPDGGFPIVVPQPRSFPEMVTSGWSDAGVILPWTLYRRYGETRVIEESWQAMEAWLSYIGSANPDFVFRNRRGKDLGDWLSVDAKDPWDETTPRVLIATAYWAHCATLMEEMAHAIKREADADRYAELRRQIGAAFAASFVKPDGMVGNGSQTSHVLALYFRLVPASLAAAATAYLVADIRRRGMKLSTGFLGTPYLLDVLADNGQIDVAVSLLLQVAYPSWGYMLSKGATTMWERWNGDVGDVAMNSYNHYAFGAVVGFIYRRLAGIAAGAPGFRRIEVKPVYDSRIGPIQARYESCVGVIATEVSGDSDGLGGLKIEVPPNTAALVHLPKQAASWREGRRKLAGRKDLHIVMESESGLVLEIGSGRYEFVRGSR